MDSAVTSGGSPFAKLDNSLKSAEIRYNWYNIPDICEYCVVPPKTTLNRDYTDMGGVGGAFLTTHWSLIEDVKKQPDQDCALIGLLLERYWKPVYYYLRHKGYDNEQAKDLTQGFFHEIVLNLNLFERADQSRGRFRSFLLYALNQYLMNEKRRETAQKNIPKHKIVSLDAIEPPSLPQTVIESSPEDS